MDEQNQHPLDAFVAQYERDMEEGCVRDLAEYLSMFPGSEIEIALEYVTLREGPKASADDGNHLGPYRKIKQIGAGGQGVVWLAEDSRVNRRLVALKILKHGIEDLDAMDRFRREAEVTARLDHESICPVYDVGLEHEPPYFVMRFVEGENLGQRIIDSRLHSEGSSGSYLSILSDTITLGQEDETERRKPRRTTRRTELSTILELIEKTARALHVAHEEGIVHRDIKPGNIMVTFESKPVVLDFGLARDLSPGTQQETEPGSFFGTPSYMSPEQLAGQHIPLDRRTDVYSLGVTLYECLTLRKPFEQATRAELYQAIMAKEPPDPRRFNPSIPKDLVAVLKVALEKDRDLRYLSALAFAEDLARIQRDEPVRARAAGPLRRATRWARRNKPLATSIALAFITFVVVPILLAIQLNAARQQARRNRLLADILECDRLLTVERDELYPLVPKTVPRMKSWIADAHELVDRNTGEARRTLEALDLEGRITPAKLAEHFTAVATLESTLANRRTLMQQAIDLPRKSIEAHAAAWQDAIADIKTSPRYAGLELTPQLGLVPFRKDPGSELWEFWHLQSGTIPDQAEISKELQLRENWPIILVLIPKGILEIPAHKERSAHKRPVPAFFIAKHEVSQAQWQRCMRGNPSHYSPDREELTNKATLLHPVEQVSWNEAWTYALRHDLILPTEILWEYACRGRTQTLFWWGSRPEPKENIGDQSLSRAFGRVPHPSAWDDGYGIHAPLGCFPPNPFGLHDMQGNVSEWCGSTWREMLQDLSDDPEVETIPGKTDFRTSLRGGHWRLGSLRGCQSDFRALRDPVTRSPIIGLRVARMIQSDTDD